MMDTRDSIAWTPISFAILVRDPERDQGWSTLATLTGDKERAIRYARREKHDEPDFEYAIVAIEARLIPESLEVVNA